MKKIDNKAVVMTELNRELVRLGKLLPRTDAGKEALEVCEGAISNVTNERFKRDMIRYLKAKFPDHLLDEPCPKPVEVRTVNAKKTAHTPGPWIADLDLAEPVISSQGAPYEPQVAVCSPIEGEAEANARLIAAAPEGLEFAKRMKLYFDSNPNGYQDLRLLCEAFLAKATGGAE